MVASKGSRLCPSSGTWRLGEIPRYLDNVASTASSVVLMVRSSNTGGSKEEPKIISPCDCDCADGFGQGFATKISVPAARSMIAYQATLSRITPSGTVNEDRPKQ